MEAVCSPGQFNGWSSPERLRPVPVPHRAEKGFPKNFNHLVIWIRRENLSVLCVVFGPASVGRSRYLRFQPPTSGCSWTRTKSLKQFSRCRRGKCEGRVEYDTPRKLCSWTTKKAFKRRTYVLCVTLEKAPKEYIGRAISVSTLLTLSLRILTPFYENQ